MTRLLPVSLCLFAALVAGCGGSGLFATVPPPVELAPSGGQGLVQLPAAGTYRGTLVVERVTMIKSSGGDWTEESANVVSGPERSEGIVDNDGKIDLHLDRSTESLFRGVLQVSRTKPPRTVARLTAFDGHQEQYPYTLVAGQPNTLKITARGLVTQDNEKYSFDRYSFELSP